MKERVTGNRSILTSNRIFDPHVIELVVAFEDFAAQLRGRLFAKLVTVFAVTHSGWRQGLFGESLCWLFGNRASHVRREERWLAKGVERWSIWVIRVKQRSVRRVWWWHAKGTIRWLLKVRNWRWHAKGNWRWTAKGDSRWPTRWEL